MALRFRRSMKLGPGVRLNVGKKSAGLSFGGKGFRYSANTSGRKTRTLGIPGTGASWISHANKGTRRPTAGRSRAAPTPQLLPSPKEQRTLLEQTVPKPGLFAAGWESQYRRGVIALAMGELEAAVKHFRQASSGDSKNSSDDLFLAFALIQTGATDEAAPLLERVIASDVVLPDKLQLKYCKNVAPSVMAEIVPGIRVEVPFDGSGAALLLAELYQASGRLDEAIDLVEGLGEAGFDEELTSLSLAELHSQKGDWASVVAATEGTQNADDLTATILTYRAAALREQGLMDAALAAAQEALRSRSRSTDVLLAARYQKARALEAQGKSKMAQREYEKIAASQSSYADVTARLAELTGSTDKA